jgi:phosphoglycolate phosphatase
MAVGIQDEINVARHHSRRVSSVVKPMNKYDSIIFDLDGTLWDACEASAIGLNKALKRTNISHEEITADVMRSVCGLPFDDCLNVILGKNGSADLKSISPIFSKEEKKAVESIGGNLFEYVNEGLEVLSNHYKLFLVSNSQSWYLKAFWKQHDVKKFFNGSDCYGDSRVSKTEMINIIKGQYNLNNPIYIGDTKGDMESTLKAKIAFGYAEYGFGKINSSVLSFGNFEELTDYFIKIKV